MHGPKNNKGLYFFCKFHSFWHWKLV